VTFKSIFIGFNISILVTLSPVNTILAEDCVGLFNKLDRKPYRKLDKDRIKKMILFEESLFKAIDKCKKKSGMFVLMGEVQIDMRQIPLAIVYGEKAVELDGKYWRAHGLLGSARLLNHETESGLKSLRQAVSLAPSNIKAKLNLVSALLQNNRFDEALDIINGIIAINDNKALATAYYLRSKIYKNKGLVIEADKDLKEAKRLGFSPE